VVSTTNVWRIIIVTIFGGVANDVGKRQYPGGIGALGGVTFPKMSASAIFYVHV